MQSSLSHLEQLNIIANHFQIQWYYMIFYKYLTSEWQN